MADKILVYGTPVQPPVDPDFGIPARPHPVPPIQLPPLPPGWVMPPIYLPPGGVAVPPIYLPETPDNTLPVPPATIWPPLPPGTGIAGKVLLLVWIVGVGYRWIVVQGTEIWPPKPPEPEPK